MCFMLIPLVACLINCSVDLDGLIAELDGQREAAVCGSLVHRKYHVNGAAKVSALLDSASPSCVS